MSGAPDVVVVGAGVAGLSCARALVAAGRDVLVLERARGVGGRCATRRVEGLPFDIGPAFVHGRSADFLAAVRETPARRVESWPLAVQGTGRPCQPEAFQPGEERFAFEEGMTAFPKHLARGLTVRTEARVDGLDLGGPVPRLRLGESEVVEAPMLVLAMAPEQVLHLLDGAGELPRSLASVRALLASSSSEPSLALAAVYPEGTVAPSWQACYPDGSRALQLAVHESSKRGGIAGTGVLFQARPGWSHQHLEDLRWPEALLAEAARVLGPWAARPSAFHPHRWRYARTGLAGELAGPVLTRVGQAWVGFCGDRFAPGGGLEAAWLSGRELGRQLAVAEG